MKLPIYLDYSATTPVDPSVAQRIMECLTIDGNFGNPASRSHLFGWKAEEAVENARRQVEVAPRLALVRPGRTSPAVTSTG